MSLWTQNGKLLVDSNGRLIECDHCPCTPCGGCTPHTSECHRFILRITGYPEQYTYVFRKAADPICVEGEYHTTYNNPVACTAGAPQLPAETYITICQCGVSRTRICANTPGLYNIIIGYATCNCPQPPSSSSSSPQPVPCPSLSGQLYIKKVDVEPCYWEYEEPVTCTLTSSGQNRCEYEAIVGGSVYNTFILEQSGTGVWRIFDQFSDNDIFVQFSPPPCDDYDFSEYILLTGV